MANDEIPEKIFGPYMPAKSTDPIPDSLEAITALDRSRYLAVLRRNAVEGPFQAEMERLKERFSEVRREWDDQIELIETQIQIGHRRLHAAGDVPLKLDLPYATYKVGNMPTGKLKVLDEEAFRAWAEENMPGAMTTPTTPEPQVDKNAFKAEAYPVGEREPNSALPMMVEGEVVPGVVLETDDRSWKVVE